MSLKKQILKSNPVCKVTFRFTKEIAQGVEEVALVGDFNNWNIESLKMNKLKNGDFTTTLDLEKGKSYEFRYLAEGKEWYNDIEADRYIANNFGTENCIVEAL